MTAPPARPRLRLSGTNLERAADHNQRVTLHAIRVNGSLTRVELAAITGLTPPAIANITKRLLTDGLIEEAGQRRGGRGQPPTKLVIRRDACYSVGVNIDRDHITIVLVDFSGQTVARVSEEIDFALPDQVRALYRRSIRAMIDGAGVDEAKIIGLGVALPDDLGSVDLPGRPAAYAAWEDVDLGARPADVVRRVVHGCGQLEHQRAQPRALLLLLGHNAPNGFLSRGLEAQGLTGARLRARSPVAAGADPGVVQPCHGREIDAHGRRREWGQTWPLAYSAITQ